MADFFDTFMRQVRHSPFLDHLYRVRWVLAGFGILLLIAIPWGLRAEERGLENASREALAEAGISAEEITFSGRSGTVTAELTPREERTATALVADLSGVRSVDFVVLPNTTRGTSAPIAVPETTTTVPTQPARVVAAVSESGLELVGTLPNSKLVAELSRLGNAFYGPSFENQLVVDRNLASPAWQATISEALAVLPMLSRGTVWFEEAGVTVEATVVSEPDALRMTKRLQDILGADIPLTATMTVSSGSLPELNVALVGNRSLHIVGVVPSRALQAQLRAVLADENVEETVDELTVGANTAATYPTDRAPHLLNSLTAANDATLRITGRELRGSMVNGATWKTGEAKISPAVQELVDALAAMLAGDPALHLTVETHAGARKNGEPNLDLSDARADAVQVALIRAGVEPDRMTVGVGEGVGALLRFRLFPADDLE